jgi:hypothetical protein
MWKSAQAVRPVIKQEERPMRTIIAEAAVFLNGAMQSPGAFQ